MARRPFLTGTPRAKHPLQQHTSAHRGLYNDKRVVIYVMDDHAEVGISIFEN